MLVRGRSEGEIKFGEMMSSVYLDQVSDQQSAYLETFQMLAELEAMRRDRRSISRTLDNIAE